MAEPVEERVQIKVLWRGVDDTPLKYVNQIAVQHDRSSIYMVAGHVPPPLLLGSPAEQAQQACELPGVFVEIAARLALSRR
ncbi:MAG: hypothetical protein ACC726_08180 [Chloroflexota bacterium]